MKMVFTLSFLPSCFLKIFFLNCQVYCICRSVKQKKHLCPVIAFSCTFRPAETRLVFLCICIICHNQASQDYKGLRISPSIVKLLPTVTLRFFDIMFFKVCASYGTFQPPFHPHLHFFNLNVVLECFVSSSNLPR